MTITENSNVVWGIAGSLGGGIYNDGYLKIDEANITGSSTGLEGENIFPGKPNEYGGTNIYAAKDVIITPKATIALGKDVRVLDGQSKIILTGPLTKQIDVSISEKALENNNLEKMARKFGYVVAAGENYTPNKSDANLLNYFGKDPVAGDEIYGQERASYDDTTSTGKWDFVLNPDTKQVVVGQRAKMIFEGNGGTFEGSAEKHEKFYDFYSSIAPYTDKTDMKEEQTPEKLGYQFMGWSEKQHPAFGSVQDYKVASVTKFDDSRNFYDLQKNPTTPITKILALMRKQFMQFG